LEFAFDPRGPSIALIRRFPGLPVYAYDESRGDNPPGSAFVMADKSIRLAAYYRWLDAGKTGDALSHWLAAETEFWGINPAAAPPAAAEAPHSPDPAATGPAAPPITSSP
jgi:hypothetical protein